MKISTRVMRRKHQHWQDVAHLAGELACAFLLAYMLLLGFFEAAFPNTPM